MKPQKSKETYVTFLRGINVGGHHKVPMADLRKELAKLGLENIETLLNSGNVIFDAGDEDTVQFEKTIAGHLERVFGFPVPTIIRRAEVISDMIAYNPFKGIEVTKDIRLYISFLREDPSAQLKLPWSNADHSYQILEKRDNAIISVLDLSGSKTVKAMEDLEKFYGKDITTRNWNTILRIGKKLGSEANG